MTTIDTNKYKDLLKKELALVEDELGSVGRKNPSNPDDWEATPPSMDVLQADENETADRIEGYEENAGILKQLEIRYNEIKAALKRIEEGTYGVCEVGGEAIEPERLGANPAATTCMKHMK